MKKVTMHIFVDYEILEFFKELHKGGYAVSTTANAIIAAGLEKLEQMPKMDIWKLNNEINAKYHKTEISVNVKSSIIQNQLCIYKNVINEALSLKLIQVANLKKITKAKLIFMAIKQIKNPMQYAVKRQFERASVLDSYRDAIIEFKAQNPSASAYQIWRAIKAPVEYHVVTWYLREKLCKNQ